MDRFLSKFGKQKFFISLVAIAVILFVLELLPWNVFSPLEKVLFPAQIAVYKTKKDVENFFGTFSDVKSLREKESQLSRQNALLIAENAKLKRLEKENKILRSQLGISEQERNLIVSSVIGQDPFLSSSRLLIDKGEASKVKNGALVVLKDILIGQVVEVGQYSSTVQLLTDPDTKIPAVTDSGVKGLLQGEFGNKISLVKVVQHKKIEEGEVVFTSGESGFPKGLVLGRIIKVEKDPAQLFQKAQVESLLDLDALDILFVTEKTK